MFLPGENHHNYKHGHCAGGNPSGTWVSWNSMKFRCDNPCADNYMDYGGRGITYCERWKDFCKFLEDMGDRPEGCSIEWLNVNGNYCPENCIWSDRSTQARNRRTSVLIDFKGDTINLFDLSELYGIPASTLFRRYSEGVMGELLIDKRNRNVFRVGSRCPTAKLTEQDVVCIKKMLADGISTREIAERFGVKQPTISNIKTGVTWSHVNA